MGFSFHPAKVASSSAYLGNKGKKGASWETSFRPLRVGTAGILCGPPCVRGGTHSPPQASAFTLTVQRLPMTQDPCHVYTENGSNFPFLCPVRVP